VGMVAQIHIVQVQEVCSRLRSQGAASVATVALLDKAARRTVDLQPDYRGFEVGWLCRLDDNILVAGTRACMLVLSWVRLSEPDKLLCGAVPRPVCGGLRPGLRRGLPIPAIHWRIAARMLHVKRRVFEEGIAVVAHV
jgi:hypothetical protein